MSVKYSGLIILLFLALNATAQERSVVVEKSSETIEIDGEKYYVHTVRKGETLFSISRAYNVSQKDVLLKNPSAYVGLQIGQVLHIPVAPPEEPEEPEEVRDTENFIYHEIDEGQTLFYISQKYNVSAGEIDRLNPGLEVDNLQIGQVVKIPRRAPAITRRGFDIDEEKYKYHRVETGETRWSISRKYGIEEEELLKANEKLAWGLRAGEYIRIPRYPEKPVEKEPEPPPAEEVAERLIPSVEDAECVDFDYRSYDRPFNVALFLPLFIDRNYPLEVPDTLEENGRMRIEMKPAPGHVESADELHPATVPFLEFYQGALIALDSLKEAGLSVNLHVFDTQRNPMIVRGLLEKPEMRDIDLVIGPVFPEVINVVSEWSRRNRVNMVSPFSTRTDFVVQNPHLFQVMPSLDTELEQAAYFISNFEDHNIVLIHSGNIRDMDTAEKLKRKLFTSLGSGSGRHQAPFKEVVYNDSVADNLHHSLNPDEENIVIIPSSNQAFVAGVLNRLNIISNRYDITLFGLSDWARFMNIDVGHLHKMELHYASPFFIDYSCDHVKYFLRQYRQRYNSEPQYYGFNGYDVTFYFLTAMKNYGRDFRACLPLVNVDLLQSDFMFRRSDNRYGFENNGLSIVRYGNDMNIMNLGLNRDPIAMMFSDVSEDTDEDDDEDDEQD